MIAPTRRTRFRRRLLSLPLTPALVCAAALAVALPVRADAALPEIRTGKGNTVPECATPARLMQFVQARTPRQTNLWGPFNSADEAARWATKHIQSGAGQWIIRAIWDPETVEAGDD